MNTRSTNTRSLTKAWSLDFSDGTPAARHRRRVVWMQRARHISQFAFGAFIIGMSVAHHTSSVDGATPSIDALCPFGGVETLWRYVSSGGQYVPKTHASNLVLLAGLVMGTLIAGGAFCGWICPFGALQDALNGLRRRLHVPEVRVPGRLDRVLRHGRFVTLAIILYQTIAQVRLVFADIDPYRTLFGLDWLFAFDFATNWLAYTAAIAILIASLVIERAWCRYLCPLGGVISVLGRFSLLRIRREESACKSCMLCERPCPVKLDVAEANVISSNCIGCMACVSTCPRHGTLELKLAPTWLDSIRRMLRQPAATSRTVHAAVAPAIVAAALLGSVLAAQSLNLWSTTGRTAVSLTQLAPADIKGWMTLQQVVDGVGIPQAELYALAGIPADVPIDSALKDLEKRVPGFETSTLRDALAGWRKPGS